MSETDSSPEDHGEARLYEIRLQGRLADRWAVRFEGLSFTHAGDGTTILAGPVIDQAALHGLLRTVRDLGLPLLSVKAVDPKEWNESDVNADKEHHHSTKETHMNAKNLIRWSGLAAMAAGVIFASIQPIHPLDVLASVTTGRWVIIQSVKFTMCLLGLFAMTGLYTRQAKEAGRLGLAGYLLFSLFYAFTAAFVFAEALILPLLVTQAPKFVAGFLGIINGQASEVSLGALPVIYKLTGLLGYVLGGVLFGIATLRARILPRWAAGLFVVGALAPAVLAQLPHPLNRTFAVPMGIALVGLGYALWTEQREPASDPIPGRTSPRLRPTAAE